MERSADLYRRLGSLLWEYLDKQRSFADLEAFIATASIDSADHERLSRVYHVLQHYEMDSDLRRQDRDYGALVSSRIRMIARSLKSASDEQIDNSIKAFWGSE